jgi:hypothetical protein
MRHDQVIKEHIDSTLVADEDLNIAVFRNDHRSRDKLRVMFNIAAVAIAWSLEASKFALFFFICLGDNYYIHMAK